MEIITLIVILIGVVLSTVCSGVGIGLFLWVTLVWVIRKDKPSSSDKRLLIATSTFVLVHTLLVLGLTQETIEYEYSLVSTNAVVAEQDNTTKIVTMKCLEKEYLITPYNRYSDLLSSEKELTEEVYVELEKCKEN